MRFIVKQLGLGVHSRLYDPGDHVCTWPSLITELQARASAWVRVRALRKRPYHSTPRTLVLTIAVARLPELATKLTAFWLLGWQRMPECTRG